jgi:glycine/D-amino acid oxidase-like deaminating enzyme
MIFAVGPWSSDLVGKLNLRLQVIRKSVFWYAARGDASRLPVFLLEQPNGVFYGFPDLGRGIKLAEHSGGQQVADPTQVDHEIDARDSNRIATFARDCVPAAGDVVDHSVCLYTMSQDSHFVVDHWPGEMGIAFAAGLSGHGFKFAPVLGQALVDMVVDGGTDLPIQFLSMARFG